MIILCYDQDRHHDNKMLEQDIEKIIRTCLWNEPHIMTLSDSEENILNYKKKIVKWITNMRDNDMYSIDSSGTRVYKIHKTISHKSHGPNVSHFLIDVLSEYHRLIGCEWDN